MYYYPEEMDIGNFTNTLSSCITMACVWPLRLLESTPRLNYSLANWGGTSIYDKSLHLSFVISNMQEALSPSVAVI